MTQLDRRSFFSASAAGAAAFTIPGRFAEQLETTPRLTEGPFYPDKLPLDTDNDLLILNDSTAPAVGEITHLSGRILSKSGEPIRNAFVEIWQVDNKGSYIHKDGKGPNGVDKNFQGYGRFLTDVKGNYYFRTIKPVPYGRRTPHIHFAVSKNGKRLLTTQLLVKGHKMNANDGVIRGLDEKVRKLVVTEFKKMPKSKLGELTAEWDLVLGRTPEEIEEEIEGGIGKRTWGSERRGRRRRR